MATPTLPSHSARRDDDLARDAAAGDAGAAEELLRRNFERIFAICRRITCHHEDAKDATQEALIAVIKGISSFDGRSSFSTWLYRVTTNAALGEVRRRERRPLLADNDASFGERPCAGAPVEHLLSDRVDIETALWRLHPDFRAAVVLRDLYDLDYATIAEILDVPEGTVRSRIFRGRSALRPMLRGAARG